MTDLARGDVRRRISGGPPVATWTLGLVTAMIVGACGGAGGPGPDAPGLDPRSPLALYPLEAGRVWSYNVDTGEGTPTLAITRVLAVRGDRVEVSSGGDPVVYLVDDGDIRYGGVGGWLLRAPVEQGASWDGRGGRAARVVADGETVEVPAGVFDDCVTVEERDDETGRRIATTYCPGVGPVRVDAEVALEVSGGVQRARAVLLGTNVEGDVEGGIEVLSRPDRDR